MPVAVANPCSGVEEAVKAYQPSTEPLVDAVDGLDDGNVVEEESDDALWEGEMEDHNAMGVDICGWWELHGEIKKELRKKN